MPGWSFERASSRAVTTLLLGFCVVVLCTFLGRFPSAQDQTTTAAADRFVDSVGVNIHLHYFDTLYRDFDMVKSRLLELKVRHVRDGMIDTTWEPYYQRHEALGQAGIKGVFITSADTPRGVLVTYPSRLPSSFEAYEAPNEYNQSGDPAWPSTLRASLTELHSLRSIPALARFPVFGPSLTRESAYAALGDITSLVDVGNLHNYFAGHNPGTPGWGSNGYGSIDWNLRLVRQYARDKPIITTETGYWDDLSTQDAVPSGVAAKYMPRLLLEQFRKGIFRTYIYELFDFQKNSYGLLTRDGSPKASFNAVKSLLTLMDDPGPGFTPRPLEYSVSGGGPDLRHMAFAKRDGRYLLALWLETPGYDVNLRRTTGVPVEPVTVTIEPRVHALSSYQWGNDGNAVRTAISNGQGTFPVTLTDSLAILEIGG